MAKVYDVIVIGSGPSGYTAAIYAARANLSVLMFQGYETGGQLMQTTDVENYPGFEEGIQGPDMMEKFEAQARRFGAEMVARDAVRVNFTRQPFMVATEEREYEGRAVIAATGASAKWLGIAGEQRLQGRGVSGCATCHGPFFPNKVLAVVGGGGPAMEEAPLLPQYPSRGPLLHPPHTLPP